jgi:arylsulfatase A-like enzyme
VVTQPVSASVFRTAIQLPAGGRTSAYATGVAVPLVLAMVLAKLVKLPTARSEGVFAADLLGTAWSQTAAAVISSDLTAVLVLTALAAWFVQRRPPGRQRVFAALGVGSAIVLLLSFGLADGVLIPPPSTDWLRESVAHLGLVGALFWREAVLFVGLLVALAWHAKARPALPRSILVWAGLAAVALLLAIDGAYFAAARAEISTEELFYTLGSPVDALTAARDGLALDTVVMSIAPFAALALAFALGRSALARRPDGAASALGAWIWPVVLVAAFGTLGTLGQRVERLSGNPLMRVAGDVAASTAFAAWSSAHADLPPNRRVPDLDPASTTLHSGDRTQRYNVVLILLESLRADATTVHSPELPTTPFLQEFARDSLVVDSMYANVPRTSAAWLATVTGRYPGTVAMHRRWWTRADGTELDGSLARQLGALGYATAFFVPTRLDFENDAAMVRDLGFEHVVSRERLDASLHRPLNAFGMEDRALLPPLRQWLDAQAAASRPFFLTIMTNVGHFPYSVPRGTPKRAFPGVTPQKSDYYNAVAYGDGFVRDVVAALQERGLLERSLVVIMGDHGEAFGEHGLVWHTGVVYEEALRIPAIVRLPVDLQRAGRIGGLRQQIDVFPTVVDVLGLESRGGRVPGRSLVGDPAGHDALFFATHFDNGALALRHGDLKFVYRFGRRPTEAYRLSTDPLERHDVAGTLPARDVAEAERDMRAWLAEVRSTYTDAP